MSCTPLPKAAKPVWAKQLTRLPCLVVYAKFQFVYIPVNSLNASNETRAELYFITKKHLFALQRRPVQLFSEVNPTVILKDGEGQQRSL